MNPRLGVLLLPTDPWPETVRRAQNLDAWGYDHLWVYDHLSWRRYRDRPWHSTFPWLTGIASETSRIRLGTMVANPSIRHPLLLAKDCMTIDHISGGRLTLGIGAGGTGFDATAMGQKQLSAAQRMDRLVEFVAVTDSLLRGDLSDHSGDWYQIAGARMLPGCVQQPRPALALAASGERGLRLVAQVADAWITFGDASGSELSASGTEKAVSAQLRTLEAHCERLDRDPAEIDRIFLIGNTEENPLQSFEAFQDFEGRYRSIGFTDLVFHDPRPDDVVWNGSPELVEEIASKRY